MLNLTQMVERFLDDAVRQCRDERQIDEVVIGAIKDRNQDVELRQTECRKWLRSYGVFRGLNDVEAANIVRAVLEFADARPMARPASEKEIVECFNDLHGRCKRKVRQRKDGTHRDLHSLTSKALWCCYPDAIPILDAYAERSLWMISRLMGFNPSTGDERYNRFVSVWLNLYQRVEPTMDADRLGDYPYKVKVLDRILWIIGQPDYGLESGIADSKAMVEVGGEYTFEIDEVVTEGIVQKAYKNKNAVILLGDCLDALPRSGREQQQYRVVKLPPAELP